MDVQLIGTGGTEGWPRPGCRCAGCARGRGAGRRRAPAAVIVDGQVRFEAGQRPRRTGPGTDQDGDGPDGDGPDGDGPDGNGPDGNGPISDSGRDGPHVVRRLPGGWDITGPDGGRLLLAAGSGAVPAPGDDAGPYDYALLDLAADPFQLGDLKRRGLVRAVTAVAACFLDDRIGEQEMARRCRLWGVLLPADGDRLGGTAPGAARPARTLVLGGARSGKSREAELRLAAEPDVTYLATGSAPDAAADPDWAARIAAHRARRPRGWKTAEGGDAAGQIRYPSSGALLLDSIGVWLAGVLDESGSWDEAPAGPGGPAAGSAARRADAAIDELVEAWRQAPARIVAVSEEAGSGVVPPTRAGRLFRDRLGQLNQRLAAESEEVVLVVAGRILNVATSRE